MRAGRRLRVRRLRVTGGPRLGARLVALGALALVLGGCSAGTSPVEACVQHALEEGVDRADAQPACEGAVGDGE